MAKVSERKQKRIKRVLNENTFRKLFRVTVSIDQFLLGAGTFDIFNGGLSILHIKFFSKVCDSIWHLSS